VLPALYDDGGFSGGTMERPALKRLIADIEAGQIDVIVVYKVDRLTRALSDFAKLVDVFDRRGVSFVSITQQFNTTTSMGRLTLNVLLSFAQFEREVTGERIRDKVAASKKALAALWSGIPVQRCTVHKHRNLLAHAPDRLHEEISADYKDMIYAGTKQAIEAKRKAFIRKWRLKCKAVADSLEEAGDKLFTFTRFPKSQWKSIRTSNAIERLHEEFKRRIKTQTVLPSAETAAMLFWALLASGQITMRKVDGWQLPIRSLTSPHNRVTSSRWRSALRDFA
jgi:hypothetical protein